LESQRPRIRKLDKIKSEDNWNLPNALTSLRIALAPIIVLLLLDDDRFRNNLAALAVVVAALTDFLDGYVARKQEKVTSLGQFLDPLADKICISTAFVMLSVRGKLSRWVPSVIIGREVLITLFRVYAGSRGSSVPASIWGKLKTNSQLVALMFVILDHDNSGSDNLEKASVALAVILTLYSGFNYMKKAGSYLTVPEGE
jgi:CDP-diacylglycerol---glycerol-3-phosphate 3-phosphatidyltransferase